MRPRAKTAGPKRSRDLATLAPVLSAVGALAPPLTVVTSLMLYFGWARSAEQARFMGVDVSLFGYTTQDYVLRSIRTLYIPLLVVMAAALCCLALHRRVLRALTVRRTHRGLRAAGTGALCGGLAATAFAVIAATLRRDWAPLVVPLVLAAGTAVAAYGGWLARVASGQDLRRSGPLWQQVLHRVLVGSVLTLALFWELSVYATVTGRGSAYELADSLTALPSATGFSPQPLGVEAAGVREDPVQFEGSVRHYRISGLRLLVRSGGKVFLLHDGWSPHIGTVVVLPDDGRVRWQYSRSP